MCWIRRASAIAAFLAMKVVTFPCVVRCSPAEQGTRKNLELPFRLCNQELIVVKGRIGNLGDLNILLDTATNPSIISPDLARRLNLSGAAVPSLSTAGRIEVQNIILPNIEVGPLHLESSRAVVQDLGFVQRDLSISIAAVAGLDLLSTRSFMIDFAKRKIVFELPSPGKSSIRLEAQSPRPTVKVDIGGLELRLLVDSGTSRLLVFRPRFDASLARLQPFHAEADAFISTPLGTVHTTHFRASQVSLGGTKLAPQVIVVADTDPGSRGEFDGLLGLTQTGFHHVWLDFQNGLLAWD